MTLKLTIDIEANGLVNPTKIWVVVCKDIDTGQIHIFRNITDDDSQRAELEKLLCAATKVVGHNCVEYDLPVLRNLARINIPVVHVLDTLILSRLIDYSRTNGHSIEAYGEEFEYPKLDNKQQDFFKQWSQELEDYCVRDTEICARIYTKYLRVIDDSSWHKAIRLEHNFQLLVNKLHTNGFAFNVRNAGGLLRRVEEELVVLDKDILEAFPPREVLIREFTPKATKYGTISKSSVPRSLWDKISDYTIGNTYRHTKSEPFNPSSPKQIVAVLSEAGWRPTAKTATHIETEREYNRLKYSHRPNKEVDLPRLEGKLFELQKTGWKVNEENLATLPKSAPPAAKLLAKRILLESRRRTLTEWMSLVRDDGRIHGKIYGIGTWTHRTSSQKPNMQNIPTGKKLYAKEMRQLWCAPKNRLLIGIDADSIQFRIAAHYINDPGLIKKIVNGKKADGTDPHTYNRRVIGDFCPSRDASKRVLFSLILGGSPRKFAEIMQATVEQGELARDNLYKEYPGLIALKNDIVVDDAKRGWFVGLDGRKVKIPGETVSERKHLCPSGYLQNGEAVVMKHATVRACERLKDIEDLWYYVNIIHDEDQFEGPNNMDICLRIAKTVADCITEVGEELGCRCPLAGSYYNDDRRDWTIGTNWYQTH